MTLENDINKLTNLIWKLIELGHYDEAILQLNKFETLIKKAKEDIAKLDLCCTAHTYKVDVDEPCNYANNKVIKILGFDKKENRSATSEVLRKKTYRKAYEKAFRVKK